MSCPAYFRISIPFIQALERLKAWSESEWLELPVGTDRMSMLRPAPDGLRTAALFSYHNAGWTVFDDMSGYFTSVPAQEWMEFARGDSFFLANYNTATQSAELIVIESGIILREFLQDNALEETVDVGKLPAEENAPIRSWLEVASIIDDDRFYGSTTGRLLRRGSYLGARKPD
jgi:hypothetical protein